MTRREDIHIMGQKCSALLKEKEEEEEEEEEEKSFSGKPSSSNSFLEVRKDFLWFSKEGASVSKDDDEEEDDKNAREERAPFFYQDEAEEKRGGDESAPRVVGNVSLVVQEEEEEEEEEEKKKRQRVGSKSPPKRFRWTVGEKELREATQNGDGEVTSTIFVADAHREFRLALKNSVEVEGGAAKALVSARLECCPPSSSKAANAVDVAATMRVSLEFSAKRGESGINDESRGSIVLREAYTRQVLNQGECLVLSDFFKSDIAESNATKLTTTKQKAMTSTKDRFQLVCEVDFDSLDSVPSERDDEDDINTFNSFAIVAYCVSL